MTDDDSDDDSYDNVDVVSFIIMNVINYSH